MRSRLITPLSQTMLTCLFAAAIALPTTAAELTTQKNVGGGVTVAVTPQNVSRDAKTWDFKVIFDTHSQDLKDDLVKSAVLLDGSGRRHAPIAWDGAAPGGHHREGVLRFTPLPSRQQTIELQIARPGEPKPRLFRWLLD